MPKEEEEEELAISTMPKEEEEELAMSTMSNSNKCRSASLSNISCPRASEAVVSTGDSVENKTINTTLPYWEVSFRISAYNRSWNKGFVCQLGLLKVLGVSHCQPLRPGLPLFSFNACLARIIGQERCFQLDGRGERHGMRG